jgi:hypothetical protein
MKKNSLRVFAVVCALAIACRMATPAVAQMSEVKEKPPMYSYVANWAIPRVQWGEMTKSDEAAQKLMDKAFAAGTIVGYGNDVNLIHTADGYTHDDWWSAMSMAGVLNLLEQSYKSGNATMAVLSTATKHADAIYVSRYYNWHAGSWKDVYTRVAVYKLKQEAPTNAVEMLAKNVFVPMLEKLLADGTIHEYEIDTEAIHTDDPDIFAIDVIAANAEGLDKFNAAVQELAKANPLLGPALGQWVDFKEHRDFLTRTNATYK